MSLSPLCVLRRGTGPMVAAAIHNGHDTRRAIARRLALSDQQRLQEEDPYTAEWAQVANTQIIGLRSRFEVDLNRPRDRAVYMRPEDAWGLDVWDGPLDRAEVDASLRAYDTFYGRVQALLEELVNQHGRVVVYDLHTYNHRRDRVDAPAEQDPEVNLGTGTMDRERWAPVVDRFVLDLRGHDFGGRSLDVRENVRFQGGHFGAWIHQTFPATVCCLSIEVKKFFMDEWTGRADLAQVEAIYHALGSTLPGVHAALRQMGEA